MLAKSYWLSERGFSKLMHHGFFHMDDLEPAIKVLNQRRTTLHPIADIEVVYAVNGPVIGRVNVTANHPLAAARSRIMHNRFLKPRNEFNCFFDLVFHVSRK